MTYKIVAHTYGLPMTAGRRSLIYTMSVHIKKSIEVILSEFLLQCTRLQVCIPSQLLKFVVITLAGDICVLSKDRVVCFVRNIGK